MSTTLKREAFSHRNSNLFVSAGSQRVRIYFSPSLRLFHSTIAEHTLTRRSIRRCSKVIQRVRTIIMKMPSSPSGQSPNPSPRNKLLIFFFAGILAAVLYVSTAVLSERNGLSGTVGFTEGVQVAKTHHTISSAGALETPGAGEGVHTVNKTDGRTNERS
jgi:hypothetical protein